MKFIAIGSTYLLAWVLGYLVDPSAPFNVCIGLVGGFIIGVLDNK
jgi:hypothetical protein